MFSLKGLLLSRPRETEETLKGTLEKRVSDFDHAIWTTEGRKRKLEVVLKPTAREDGVAAWSEVSGVLEQERFKNVMKRTVYTIRRLSLSSLNT